MSKTTDESIPPRDPPRCPNCLEWINADNDYFLCEECGETCCEDCQRDFLCRDCWPYHDETTRPMDDLLNPGNPA